MDTPDLQDFFKLTTMVLTDRLPKRFTRGDTLIVPVYTFTQTDDNRPSVIDTAHSLYSRTPSRFRLFILNDLDGTNKGYTGYRSWEAAAFKAGFPLSAICTVPLNEPLNTLSEAVALVDYAVREGWLDLVIVAPPFHMVRAFMSVITAIENNPSEPARDISVYCAVGSTLRWIEEVAHSQGTLRATRAELISEELGRIIRYQDPGMSRPFPLLSFRQCLKHIDSRWD